MIRLYEFLKTNETEPNFWSISIKVPAIQTSYYIHHHYYHFMDKIFEANFAKKIWPEVFFSRATSRGNFEVGLRSTKISKKGGRKPKQRFSSPLFFILFSAAATHAIRLKVG